MNPSLYIAKEESFGILLNAAPGKACEYVVLGNTTPHSMGLSILFMSLQDT